MNIGGISNQVPVTTGYTNADGVQEKDTQTKTGGVNRAGDQLIIDVKTGDATRIAGLDVDIVGRTNEIEYKDLNESQKKDIERLLAILGIDTENAKDATAITILKAIQKHIKAQEVSVTTCTQAMSDYDVERLNALKKAMEPLAAAGDANAQKIIDNVDRMMVLKAEIEDLANNQGMSYDGKFEGVSPNPNWELNTRVREMGDRIADIRHYKAAMGDAKMDSALNSLAPAMKTAVKDLLAAYDQTSGWGVQVNISYSKMTRQTLSSFIDVLKSKDMLLPDQIDKDALIKMLEKLMEGDDGAKKIEEMLEKLIEELQEIMSQVENVEVPVNV